MSSAAANAGVEVGGVAGLHTFSEDSALGVVEQGGVNPNPDGLKNSTFFGLRLGVYFNPKMGVEIEAGGIPTEPRAILFDVWMAAARAQFIYQFRTDIPNNKLIPFVTAGAGFIQIVDVGAKENEDIVGKDVKIAPYVGGGAKFRASNGWGVRGDIRALLPPKDGGGIVLEVEILASMFKDFGYKAPAKKKEEPKKDDDPDKDGIVGAADKCPDKPEDKDGFQDEDGCPDPDNDNDGIPDAQPDKCPNEPEDKDGFEDEDGCPDPDNDKDGILDKDDKCPNQPETKNGYQDEDGCPDEVPETLKKFTGAIQGINFQVGSDALAAGTNVVLDKAVAVLKEHAEVRVEIQGHTDDVALRAGGKFADNVALSQARADSVKKYMVSKGVAEDRLVSKGYGDQKPVEDPSTLKDPKDAAKLNAARAKNRRVEFKLIEAGGGGGAAPPKAEPPKADPKAPAPKTEPAKADPKK